MRIDEPLRQGRDACARRAWAEACTLLGAARDAAPLPAEDLERLATAAYLTGRDEASIDAWTSAHNAYLSARDVPRAVRCAFWLVMALLSSGEWARAGGWLATAQRLLDAGNHECAERGLLRVLSARAHLKNRNHSAAEDDARQAIALGDRFDDPELKLFGLLSLALVLTRSGRTADAVALCDEVMVGVTTRDVSPIAVGTVYCAVIDACYEILDVARAREWTEALSRWCAAQPELVPFNLPENYERYFVPAIGRPLAQDLVEEAALRPGDRVLDVACGTGIVARLAAERVAPEGIVAGADLTPGMLAVARPVAAAAPIAIQWYETSAEAMPLPDASFDVVLCQLGLQFVVDKRAALREMRRVLVPGGRAYVTVPAPTPFFDVMDAALERHGLTPAAAFVRQVFSLNDPRELERLFHDAGFSGVEVRIDAKQPRLPAPSDFVRQYFQSTPIGSAIDTVGETRRAALEREIAESWQPWVHDGGVAYTQPILVGRGLR